MSAIADSILDLFSFSSSLITSSAPWFWLTMALENLGLGFAVSWIYNAFAPSEAESSKRAIESASERKATPRSKAKSTRANEGMTPSKDEPLADDRRLYYPGLVNISGTYCFMNSVLQACASLNYLIPQVENTYTKAEYWDVPTPVTDCLRETLTTLNTPEKHRSSLRPLKIIDALSAPVPYPASSSSSANSFRSPLFSSREHQDAQELFQLLTSLAKDEAIRVDREPDLREISAGLGGALIPSPSETDAHESLRNVEVSKSVFDGLTANRRSCVICGYTEAVMHFGFNNLQLSLPLAANVTLEECLADVTRIEMLGDCICRKCSLMATHRRLKAEVERTTNPSSTHTTHTVSNGHLSVEVEGDHDDSANGSSVTSSKRKRIREAKKWEAKIATALAEGRIEDDLGSVLEAKVEKVFSRASTKQVMIARAPPVLVLHLNRSAYFGHAAAKNSCRVAYPELLDLTPWTTSGELSTVPSMPISSPTSASSHSILSALQTHPSPNSTSTAAPSSSQHPPRVWYLLSAIVCHYGGHAFGHYVAFRRKPRPPYANSSSSSSHRRFRPPTFDDLSEPLTGKGWLRISDENVEEVGIESVLSENSSIFLAFYERIVENQPNPPVTYPADASVISSPRSSSESTTSGSTIKPSTSQSHSHSRSLSSEKTNSTSHVHVNGSARLPFARSAGSETFSSASTSTSRAATPRLVRSVSVGISARSIASTTQPSPSKLGPGTSKFASVYVEPVIADMAPTSSTPTSSAAMQAQPSKLVTAMIDTAFDPLPSEETTSPTAISSARSPMKKSKHRKHKK